MYYIMIINLTDLNTAKPANIWPTLPPVCKDYNIFNLAFLSHFAYHLLFKGFTAALNLVGKSSYSSSVAIVKNNAFASLVWISGL